MRKRGRGVRPRERAEACWTKELREGMRVGFATRAKREGESGWAVGPTLQERREEWANPGARPRERRGSGPAVILGPKREESFFLISFPFSKAF